MEFNIIPRPMGEGRVTGQCLKIAKYRTWPFITSSLEWHALFSCRWSLGEDSQWRLAHKLQAHRAYKVKWTLQSMLLAFFQDVAF